MIQPVSPNVSSLWIRRKPHHRCSVVQSFRLRGLYKSGLSSGPTMFKYCVQKCTHEKLLLDIKNVATWNFLKMLMSWHLEKLKSESVSAGQSADQLVFWWCLMFQCGQFYRNWAKEKKQEKKQKNSTTGSDHGSPLGGDVQIWLAHFQRDQSPSRLFIAWAFAFQMFSLGCIPAGHLYIIS